MKSICMCLFLVTCMYFPLVWANSEDGGYYTNRRTVHDPFGKIAAREKKAFNGKFLPLDRKENIYGWFYGNNNIPSSIVPKDLSLKDKSNYKKAFNDNNWLDMWYFQDYRTNRTQPVLDLNVVPIYYKLKITGKNINIAVVDGGIEWNHSELLDNFSHDLSGNYVSSYNDYTPSSYGHGSGHGTNIAGILVMKPNNKICGIGVAYGAQIGSIKLLDNNLSLTNKAKSLNHALNKMDIYSCSWGPPDTGYNMEHFYDILKLAFTKGIEQGRNRKGSIYVFACGNGKKVDDNCACDSHVNSIHTIGVAACDDSGHPTSYSERCPAIMVTAYVGVGHQKQLVTTDLNGRCVEHFSGTSAATPVISGVVGLALSANPNLTWRDIFHLLAWTSQVAPLSDNLGWNRNKAGFYYSVDFGFGLVNAYKLVSLAKKWENVPKMNSCAMRIIKVGGSIVSRTSGACITVKSTGCKGKYNRVKFIEQVQLIVTMSYSKRGDIQVAMKSPAGTVVHVLESRYNDVDQQGLYLWSFKVLAFWGESPRGQFVIYIYDKTGSSQNRGSIVEIALVIHGTNVAPKIYRNGPRPYEDFALASAGNRPKFLRLSSIGNKYYEKYKLSNMGNSYYNYQNYYQYAQNYNSFMNIGSAVLGQFLNYMINGNYTY